MENAGRSVSPSNITKYYWYQFLSRWTLFLPYIVFYIQELGFSLKTIMALTAVMAAVVFVSEIPTGYVADRIGRKNSLIIGALLLIASTIFLYFAEGFIPLLCAYILIGLSDAFMSGANSAFLYDTLLADRREREYKRIEGKANFIAESGVILTSLLGAFVALYSIRLTILLSLFGYVAMLFVVISFKEPELHKRLAPLPFKDEVKSLADILKRSMKNPKLLGLFLYSFLILGVSNVIYMIYQPYFKDVLLPLPMYGIIFAMMSVFAGLAALYAHKWEARAGMGWTLVLIPIFLAVSLLGAGSVYIWYGVFFFFFRELVRGFVFPVLGDYTNKIAKTEERATVLSVGSMFSRLGYGTIAIVFGVFGDLIGLQRTLIWLGVIMVVIAGIVTAFAVRLNTHKPDAKGNNASQL
jgi:MFS family permease